MHYANKGGNSNIYSYSIGSDRIEVTFYGGDTYLYTYFSAGQLHIEHMKSLAMKGSGLNSYINRNVRKNYARKIA